MSVSTIIIALVAGALGYYAAVVWNRSRPGDLDFTGSIDDNEDYQHGQTTVDESHYPMPDPDESSATVLTRPKELLDIDLANLKCVRVDTVILNDLNEGPIFDIASCEINLFTELGDYVISTALFDKADITIYGIFVKAMEEAYPEYVFDDIGSFTGDFTRQYGIVEKYTEHLSKLFADLDDAEKEDRYSHQPFLVSYAYARFRKVVEVTDSINKMLTNKELVEKFHRLNRQGITGIEFLSVKDEIHDRVLEKEMFDKANSLIS